MKSAKAPITTVLVANRGEIACRVISSLKAMGLKSVAVYSDADAGARHVRLADAAVRIGPAAAARSYLDIEAIVAAAKASGAQAVHPGYGFLAENLDFAKALAAAGIVFIGPGVRALELMGDKIRAKNHVAGFDVPVVPGIARPGLSDAELLDAADAVGYPLLIKPSAGGGGKGMAAVLSHDELPAALATARRVAAGAFGDDTLFLERLIPSPRHIEVQILADNFGHVVHLGERECSLQRRHQKVIEEAPSPLLDGVPNGADIRERIGAAACNAARSVGYSGAGTVEFLVSDAAPEEFFFMEMNTRLQVEHPVTEMVTGVDLVQWQVRIAAGEPLALAQRDIRLTGHAVEARLYAEDPEHGFLPTAGRVLALSEPTGDGVRVDSALVDGLEIGSDYDPMLAKIIAWAPDRAAAIDRLDRALAGTTVLGLGTNIEYLRLLLADPDVRAGRLDTTLIGRKLPGMVFQAPDAALLAAAALWLHRHAAEESAFGTAANGGATGVWTTATGWRLGPDRPVEVLLEPGPGAVDAAVPVSAALSQITISDASASARVVLDGGVEHAVRLVELADSTLVEFDGAATKARFALADGVLWIGADGRSFPVLRRSRSERVAAMLAGLARPEGAADPQVASPMPGTVVSVNVSSGDAVVPGTVLLAVEAMKMEHQLTAAVAGIVHLTVKPGDLVKARQIVATIHATADPVADNPTAEGDDAPAGSEGDSRHAQL
ncbi:acetyl/propionyl/methylcrotonyl-CoA carboxylase subunit alpha [Arthrobacter sp. 35W]|uniref:acetyl/propionyl/methylcrotonyl-CoA carboxylase subunit alpha n=1 Tax=Arthrobacter sp. 35W TaxID=1132441 RepID=UPI000418B222|nr:biotin carboxylase N-terminal domain-containing protein [Arthrobacter sp. 35W]